MKASIFVFAAGCLKHDGGGFGRNLNSELERIC